MESPGKWEGGGRIPSEKFQPISLTLAPSKHQISDLPLLLSIWALQHQNEQLQHWISVFNMVSEYHIYMFQYNVRGDVMLVEITCAKDCTVKRSLPTLFYFSVTKLSLFLHAWFCSTIHSEILSQWVTQLTKVEVFANQSTDIPLEPTTSMATFVCMHRT